MKIKLCILIAILSLFTGCASIRNFFAPAPPLKEGEIPWVMKPGIYTDVKGIKHTIGTNEPRWSVSEAYLYDVVSETEPESKIPWKNIGIFGGGGAGVLIALLFIIKFIKKR